ncbi:MAG: dihydrofolate reductase [Bradymonadia bacterium]
MSTPHLTLVAALSTQRVIGRDNQLPWRLPADLKLFKKLTVDHTVLMGRKTYESIGRPLPKRRNIVLSRRGVDHEGIEVFNSLAQALKALGDVGEIMVIGGGEIYRQCLPMARRLALSIVQTDVQGDAWFPMLEENQWGVVQRLDYSADAHNEYDFTFFDMRRGAGEVEQVPSFLVRD